jgi:hypothetical protein
MAAAPFDLESSDWSAFIDGLARGEYHLLLGAGSSMGALGGDGASLPSAPQLAEELLERFTNVSGESSLPIAYELSEAESGEDSILDYMRRRFIDCAPSWQENIARVRWRRIWSLNVDDVVEKAYESATSSAQTISTLSWNDRYRETRREQRELLLIHLHGYAAAAESSSHFVFSVLQYLGATSYRYSWHRIFGDEYLDEPFLIIGARLVDEIDLAEILRRGNSSKAVRGRPSIVVLKTVTPAEKSLLRRWGLLVIESPAEDFFAAVLRDLPAAERQIEALLPATGMQIGDELRGFLRQLSWLRPDIPDRPPRGHDFYNGEDPYWSDVIQNLDARFQVVDEITERVVSATQSGPVQFIGCINGPPGCGKSTVLLRVGFELIKAGFDVFRFRAEEHLDRDATLWWLRQNPKTALLFDGLKDTAREVGEVAEACEREGLPVVVLGAERESRVTSLYADISARYLRVDYPFHFNMLTGRDIDRLTAKLRNERRLGAFTGSSDEEVRHHFRRYANRQLVVGMMELSGGRGFEERLLGEYSTDIEEHQFQSVYALACLTYRFGYHLPLGIASAASGVVPQRILQATTEGGKLFSIVFHEEHGLRPRHRVIASKIVESALERAEKYALTVSLAQALAPHITKQTISQGTLPARIARHLFDAEVLGRTLGKETASQWFAELAEQYGWNSRFWEQRALAEAAIQQYVRARDYAEEAVRLLDHSFTRTTLGTILMRMSVDWWVPGSKESIEGFWTAVKHLRAARDSALNPSEHEYTTFFQYAIRFSQAAKPDEQLRRRLLREWNEWMQLAEKNPIFEHHEAGRQLGTFKYEWLKLVATG